MTVTDLRPMSLGELLDRTFNIYQRNFWVFAGIMALPYAVLFFFELLIAMVRSGTNSPLAGLSSASGGVIAGTIFAGLGAGILLLVLYLALLGAAQAGTIFAVSDLYLGRPTGVRQSLQKARGKIGRLLGVMFLAGLLVGVGLLVFIIPGIILLCRTAIAVPAAMLEDLSPTQAIKRSMNLTKGHATKAFVVYVLVFLGSIMAMVMLQVPITLIAGAAARTHALPLGVTILQQLASLAAQVVVGPVGLIAFALMYYNLRVQKEAFDLQQLMDALEPAGAPSAAPVA